MPKTAFIIPGFKDTPRTPPYAVLGEVFRRKGYEPVVVNINWARKTMSDYVDQFLAVCKQHPGPAVMLGFSFGAMIAAIASARVHPSRIFLCSLSPYFAEDLRAAPSSWRRELGERRWEDFKRHSFADVARGIPLGAQLFLGGKEALRYPAAKKRALDASRTLHAAVLHVVVEAEHSLCQKEYFSAVRTVLEESL